MTNKIILSLTQDYHNRNAMTEYPIQSVCPQLSIVVSCFPTFGCVSYLEQVCCHILCFILI